MRNLVEVCLVTALSTAILKPFPCCAAPIVPAPLIRVAAANPLGLATMSENTGSGDAETLPRSVPRTCDFHMTELMRAFEPQLFVGRSASLSQISELVGKARRDNRSQQLAAQSDALHSRVRSELKVFTQWLQANKVRGFIGEVGWPDDIKGDAKSWNGLADAWLRDADKAGLWVTTWSTGEWWGTSYLLAPYEHRLKSEGVDSPNTQATALEAHLGTSKILRGVNVSGGEFGDVSNINPGIYDQKYHYDPQGTFNYLASRGLKLVRLPFRWERLQHNLNGELDAPELARLKGAVARARRAGLKVVLDMHNYGEYHTEKDGKGVSQTIGSPEVPFEAFADVWRRLSREFKGDAGVLYGLMNEPHDFPAREGKSGAQIWEAASQAALNAIRSNGDTKLVMVPGYNWSGAQGWAGTHPKSWINDTARNFRYEAHHYWDRDNSGDYPDRYQDEVRDAEQKGFKP